MRTGLILALGLVGAPAFASIVSSYGFGGNLDPAFAGNVNVQALQHWQKSGATNNPVTTSYQTANVNGVSKQVANLGRTEFFRANHGVGKNGGGQYVNRYSILFDVYLTNATVGGFASLFNTTANNGNDGDSFVRWDGSDAGGIFGSLGIAGDYAGKLYADSWNRLVVTVHAGKTTGRTELSYYINGAFANVVDASGGVDGRYSAYGWDDPDAENHIDIFGDNDGDFATGQVSSLAFFSDALSADQVQSLGGAGSVVPEPATLLVLGLGALAMRRRRR